jgi:archaellin
MRTHSLVQICNFHLSTVLMSSLALCGVLVSVTGCPAKPVCPPCYVGGVMADGAATKPSATPSSAVYLQLDSGYSSEKVSEVQVVLTDADGKTETLKYSGDKVSAINSTSLTSIADNELYSVEGKPPVSAAVEILFSSGKSMSAPKITIKPEAVIATTPTAPK